MAALRLSASTFTRTEFLMTWGSARIVSPVSLDPVKATTSKDPRCARRSPAPPISSESAPSGSALASIRISSMRCATSEDDVAGLLRTGMPARRATAAFSARPQAGKLNALMWTATPVRGTRMCWPWKRGLRARGCHAIREHIDLAQLLAQIGVGGQGEDRAVHVELRVRPRVAAVGDGEVEQLVAAAWRAS
jgi:hypothetical protein